MRRFTFSLAPLACALTLLAFVLVGASPGFPAGSDEPPPPKQPPKPPQAGSSSQTPKPPQAGSSQQAPKPPQAGSSQPTTKPSQTEAPKTQTAPQAVRPSAPSTSTAPSVQQQRQPYSPSAPSASQPGYAPHTSREMSPTAPAPMPPMGVYPAPVPQAPYYQPTPVPHPPAWDYPRAYPTPPPTYYPAPARPSSLWTNWLSHATQRLRALIPPPQPGWATEGTTWQGYMDIDSQGRWLQGGIVGSTGNQALDSVTLNAVYRATPLPPSPSGQPLRLTVVVTYSYSAVWDVRLYPDAAPRY